MLALEKLIQRESLSEEDLVLNESRMFALLPGLECKHYSVRDHARTEVASNFAHSVPEVPVIPRSEGSRGVNFFSEPTNSYWFRASFMQAVIENGRRCRTISDDR
jgi:hypothetical protein